MFNLYSQTGAVEAMRQLFPVILISDDDYDCWLNGSPDEAWSLIRSYPAEEMMIVQSGSERRDLLGG